MQLQHTPQPNHSLMPTPGSVFGEVEPSYKPGVTLTDLQQKGRGSLPAYALEAIREALPAFERTFCAASSWQVSFTPSPSR